ncbi:uncharacterized protein LOC108118159 [Drosophila eugracilis]|uniref:uncharacterized protein LOC108118159 n=1 Tax=Drosophila eugracilis TaxID=29029 RepID=UPI0007E8A038|nr:uncharacterized protein LOC108118159 [Drosophila eugracilis]
MMGHIFGVFKRQFSPRLKTNMAGQRSMIVLIVATILALSIPGIFGKSCRSSLQLRAQNDPIDLSQLSEKQLQQLVQQLANLQSAKDEADDDLTEEDEEDTKPNLQDLQDPEDDHRGGSRPWNRVQRIIRRQLVKIPKKYLKKLLRQFGLARSAGYSGPRRGEVIPQLEEYYLIPLE